MSDEKLTPFDIAKNINNKNGVLDEDTINTCYDPYITNIIFSNTRDTVFMANEVNKMYGLSKSMQYKFYYYGINKNPKRFGRWNKKDKISEVEKLVMKVYGYSKEKAAEVAGILTDENIKYLKDYVFTGGMK